VFGEGKKGWERDEIELVVDESRAWMVS